MKSVFNRPSPRSRISPRNRESGIPADFRGCQLSGHAGPAHRPFSHSRFRCGPAAAAPAVVRPSRAAAAGRAAARPAAEPAADPARRRSAASRRRAPGSPADGGLTRRGQRGVVSGSELGMRHQTSGRMTDVPGVRLKAVVFRGPAEVVRRPGNLPTKYTCCKLN